MIMPAKSVRTQNSLFSSGDENNIADPFPEFTSASIADVDIPKSSKTDPICVSNGAIAGSIIGTLIISAFIGFLTWLIYLRPKFQELHYKCSRDKRRITNIQKEQFTISSVSIPYHHQQQQHKKKYEIDDDANSAQLPIDVTDCKFGTFPFRQSESSSVNGHYNRAEKLHRLSSSFRTNNKNKDTEMLDIEFLEPTFDGLNFSITGNMRAGIFVKEILKKATPQEQTKSNSCDQLKAGDRIVAMTICFQSIVYEDALTILSYASPYPVILRVERPRSNYNNNTKVNVVTEQRLTAPVTSSKVKWRDDLDNNDNDHDEINNGPKIHATSSATRKYNSNPSNKAKPSSIGKCNRIKISPNNNPITGSGAVTKRSHNDIKRRKSKTNNYQQTLNNQATFLSTGLTDKLPRKISTPTISTHKKTVKSVTDAVISYLHYKGGQSGVERSTVAPSNSEGTIMPYYDSPYDYYCGGRVSQYQYLHQSHLNRNNNNSLSAESLTAVTPNLTSFYTLKLSSTKSCRPIQHRCERRLSSPAIVTTAQIEITNINMYENEGSFNNPDSFV